MGKIAINFPVTLYPQPTKTSCWAAAASMVLGNQSAGPGKAKTETDGVLQTDEGNMTAFARSHNLERHYGQTWTLEGLKELLEKHGPLWVGGYLPDLHAVVIAGMNGDGSTNGTELLIYDPWPVNKGSIVSISYHDFYTDYPAATNHVLHKK